MASTLCSAERCLSNRSLRSPFLARRTNPNTLRLTRSPTQCAPLQFTHFSRHHQSLQQNGWRCSPQASTAQIAYSACPSDTDLQPKSDSNDLPKLVAVCATCFALVAFVSCGFPSTSPCFAALSLAAGEAVAGAHVAAAKSAWAGLAAGFLHTLCGPDHLAALTPLTIGRPRASATLLGALWGFGHSTGQLILGLFFVLLKERFNNFLPALSKWAGVIVGLTLLAIGFLGIYETLVEGGHAEEHVNLAVAGADGTVVSAASQSAKFGLATYATGIVYGLQPDALFVVIPALALPTKLAAIAYCTMFVVGTVTAMGGYTLLIGTTSQAIIKQKPWLQAHLSTIASGVAIVVGGLILAAGCGVAVPFFS